MASPANCRYSESHEWFRVEGKTVTVGITKFAADELTDITYVEMKPAGTKISAGGSVGEVESVKTTSDIYSAITGTIVAVNADATKDPSLVNTDSFGRGWLVQIECADVSPLEKLMDATTYDKKNAGH
ncbi:MAG: glycine cleavage system protein GcvH [Phycisphaerae bacterium]|jgi:glycine cleavage system H protein|nr:glycine cleavage system protein GcvH [Phycisphaerae bacterium]